MPSSTPTPAPTPAPVGGGPIIVKLGGAALDDGAQATQTLDGLFASIAALRASNTGGPSVVIVHGGGAAVDTHLARLNLVSERRDGIRVTPPEHIDEIVAVLAGRMNKRLVGRLQKCGVPAVGLCLSDGYLAHTVKATGYAFDPGHVGEIDGGDPRLVVNLIAGGFVPVFSSIGLDDAGAPLNVNADHAAAGLGALLHASRVILLTDVPGVLDDDEQVIGTLTSAMIDALIERGSITGGMIPKVKSAVQLAEVSGVPVTIAGWNDDDALTTGGTRILPDNESSPEPEAAFSPFLRRCLTRR